MVQVKAVYFFIEFLSCKREKTATISTAFKAKVHMDQITSRFELICFL